MTHFIKKELFAPKDSFTLVGVVWCTVINENAYDSIQTFPATAGFRLLQQFKN
jgi:hypothetical protein